MTSGGTGSQEPGRSGRLARQRPGSLAVRKVNVQHIDSPIPGASGLRAWSGWRGPLGRGVLEEGSLPSRWSAGSDSIRWRAAIPGKGFSSPILLDEQVLVTTAFEAGGDRLPADSTLGAVGLLSVIAWSSVLVRARGHAGAPPLSVGASGWLVWLLLGGCGAAFLVQDFVWVQGLHSALLVALGLAVACSWRLALRRSSVRRGPALLTVLVGGLALGLLAAKLPPRHGFFVLVLGLSAAFLSASWHSLRFAGASARETIAACERAVVRAAPLTWILVILATAVWPLAFWDESTAQHVVRRSSLLVIPGLTLGLRWLPVHATLRRLFALALLVAGAALWQLLPDDTVAASTLNRALTAVPAGLAAAWLAFANPRARTAFGDTSLRVAGLLLALSVMVFARANFLQPRLRTIQAVVCLDARDGKELWRTEVFETVNAHVSTFRTSNASPTPCSDGRNIIAHFGNGTACLDRAGGIRWRHENPGFTAAALYGAGSSPLIVGDTAVVLQERERMLEGEPSTLSAFGLESGEQRWRHVLESARSSYGTPILVEERGVAELVAASWRSVVAFDAASGERLWSLGVDVEEIVTSPVHDSGHVYVAGGSMRGKTLGLRLPARAGELPERCAPQVLWETARSSSCCASPVLYRGLLFALDRGGVLTCYEAQTGSVHWSERVAPGEYFASLVAGDGKVYATSSEGLTTVVAADDTFRILAENALEEAVFASPALGEGFLILRGEEHLFRVDG